MGYFKNLSVDRALGIRTASVIKSADGIGLVVTGHKEIDAKLAALPLTLQKRALRPVMRSAAKTIQKAAKRYAPTATGRLKRSIKVRSFKRSRKRIGVGISAGEGFVGGGELPWYAVFVEFGVKDEGSADRTNKAGKNRGRIQPQPFLRRAMRENEPAIRRNFARKLDDEIRKLQAKEAAKKVAS